MSNLNFAPVERLERQVGGRVGLAAINPATGKRLEYRSDERFPMCSTFKLPLVAIVLSRVDFGDEELHRMIEFSEVDILEHAPVTKERLPDGKMSVAELCAAALQVSDNTAANLLLQMIGGPKAFTRYVQALGDNVTRLDRFEPFLNSNIPDDPRDTTTPAAMLTIMQRFFTGNTLSRKSREQLTAWLLGNRTGQNKLRAGLSSSWVIGNKTGSGENGASNDIAVVWPTRKSPLLIAAYYTNPNSNSDQRSDLIAEVGRLVSVAFHSKARGDRYVLGR